MFNVGSLTKQTIAVLDKYLTHYQLQCYGNRKAKLCEVLLRHITHQLHGSNQTAYIIESNQPLTEREYNDEDPFSSCDEDEDETDFAFLLNWLKL